MSVNSCEKMNENINKLIDINDENINYNNTNNINNNINGNMNMMNDNHNNTINNINNNMINNNITMNSNNNNNNNNNNNSNSNNNIDGINVVYNNNRNVGYNKDLDTTYTKKRILNTNRSLKNTYHNNNYNKNNHQNFSINKNNKNNKNFRNKNIQYNKTNMKQNKGNMNMNMNINMIDNNMMENNQENIKNIYNSGDNINVEHSYNGNNNDILNNMYYEENEKSDDYSSLSNNQNLVNKVANNRNVYENMRLINNTNNGNNSSMYNNTNNEDNNEINVYNNNMKSVYSNEDMDTFNDNNNILQNDDLNMNNGMGKMNLNRNINTHNNNNNNIKKRRIGKYENNAFYNKNKVKKNLHNTLFNDSLKRYNNNSINLKENNNKKNDNILDFHSNEKDQIDQQQEQKENINEELNINEDGSNINKNMTFIKKDNYNKMGKYNNRNSYFNNNNNNKNNNNNSSNNNNNNNNNNKPFNNMTFSLNKYLNPYVNYNKTNINSRNINSSYHMGNKNKLLNKNRNMKNNANPHGSSNNNNNNNNNNNTYYNSTYKNANERNHTNNNCRDDYSRNNLNNINFITQNFNMKLLSDYTKHTQNDQNNLDVDTHVNTNPNFKNFRPNNRNQFYNNQNYIECLSEVSEISDEETNDLSNDDNMAKNQNVDNDQYNNKWNNLKNNQGFKSLPHAESALYTNNFNDNNNLELINGLYKLANFNKNLKNENQDIYSQSKVLNNNQPTNNNIIHNMNNDIYSNDNNFNYNNYTSNIIEKKIEDQGKLNNDYVEGEEENNMDMTNKNILNFIKPDDMYINSYIPYPPEKYNNIYDLHEIKILSPHILKTLFQKEANKTYHSSLKDGKLILLLDLDNTLLQATSFAKFNMELPLENFVDDNGEAELYKFYLPQYNFFYYLKFRPYVRQFLQILSLYYELAIYTNATREYADVVIAILDPDRTIFSDRIVARCSSTDRDENKYFSRIYPNVDPKYVIAFDDRKDVWIDIPQSHILKAEHYNFFELSKYDIISHFKEPTTARKKFVDMDMHLHYMIKFFLKLHKNFFENPLETDVGKLIDKMMGSTLSNVGVYFTGFRKNSKNIQNVLSADCEERQKEIALELGATIFTNYDEPGVTHIIAAKNCTDNLIKSKKSDYDHILKVHTLWLYHCRGTLEKRHSSNFDADNLCKIYSNKPPLHPKKDHWFFGPKEDFKKQEDNKDCVKIENLKIRTFLGTGEYTNDAVIFSPFEQINIKWIEKEVTLRQNFDTSYNAMVQNIQKEGNKNQINDDNDDENNSYINIEDVSGKIPTI
ncbi:hypothetical protein C923_04928 [Plasmodium falciparum UGT5.1]|uniref:protein-serine/threonine phosphatase n=1 Tax=Plasmodium falciparum UGT5.1 TaxID=1237627 RepID=W7JI06_PLAFA|nr:hypothetical protein C923_04928 [Plasmodium falciparum UGT5.1]